MRPRPLTVLAGAGLLGVATGLVLRAWRPRRAPLELVVTDEAEVDALSSRVAREARRGAGELVRVPLDEDLVAKLMPLDQGHRVWDPYCYFRSDPDLDYEREWAEYEGGAFRIRTNSLGLRMDREPAGERPDLRVWVAGDSHLTGVCANPDCTTGRLEALLAAADPARSVQVFNGSQGAYSFYHYLGVLERALALDLAPDVFVVVVYGGNDFLAVYLWHFFTGTRRVARTPDQTRRFTRAAEQYPAAIGQVLNAVEYFRVGGEEEVENALVMATQTTDEIRLLCETRGIELVLAYLPAPSEVPGAAEPGEIAAGLESLGLAQDDLSRIGEMADRYLDAARGLGVEVVDLRPAFRAAERELYWRRDLHLAVAGHELAARALVPAVEAAWRRGRSGR